MVESLDILDGALRAERYIRTVSITPPASETTAGYFCIWLPQKAKNGGWVCVVQTSWLHNGTYSIAPGQDEIDAFLSAIYMIRSFIDQASNDITYNDQKSGNLPLWPNEALSFDAKSEIVRLTRKLENLELGFDWEI